nr:clp protease proteolytic subunit [Cryptolepis buchananii]
MPVGVPKVPFRIPGEEEASWVDIYNRLYRQRLLFLGQEVDSEIGNQLVGLMVFLNMEDPTKEQFMFINSPGGWVIPGVAIYDMMQTIEPDVTTICLGVAASMATFILVGGTITKRIAFPHARVMIHQPASVFTNSQAIESVLEAEELNRLRNNVIRILGQRTGQPFWIVSRDIQRDVFMSATEAQAYGIVDSIGL